MDPSGGQRVKFIIHSCADPGQACSCHTASAAPRGIIIGASDGLGAALARRLAREGYTLALLARRKDKLDSLCQELNTSLSADCAYSYVHDVGRHEEVPALLRRIVADLGGLDLVVYCAGINRPPGGIDKYNFENDRQMIEINLVGAMAWLTPVAEMFQAARAGQIVGIGSVAGDRGRVGNPGYNTSKAGLATFLEALRNRLTRAGSPRIDRQTRLFADRHAQGGAGRNAIRHPARKSRRRYLEGHPQAQAADLHARPLALDHAGHPAYTFIHI